ncbi:MAG: HD domain-containing protein [Dehalococcoidia bacterium]|nr:HD domain-containing protein [Dehalococcoidia bacterium]
MPVTYRLYGALRAAHPTRARAILPAAPWRPRRPSFSAPRKPSMITPGVLTVTDTVPPTASAKPPPVASDAPDGIASRPRRRIPVPSAIFTAGGAPSFLVFDDQGAPVDAKRDFLRDGPATVHVVPSDLEALNAHLQTALHTVVAHEGIAAGDRAWALHRARLAATAGLLRGEERLSAAADVSRACRQVALFTLERPDSFRFLDVIAGNQFTPVTRAVETAIFAVSLAAAEGLRDPDTLTAIALAGVFADTGKLTLSGELLAKAAPLGNDEWERMREHPARSAEIMHRCGIVEATALRGARHHHERWDGSGYPGGLRGEDIPPEARYLAIADAYSALTVDRPFSEHRDPFGALSEMAQTAGQFEPRLLRLFVPLLCFSQETDAAAAETTEAQATPEVAA